MKLIRISLLIAPLLLLSGCVGYQVAYNYEGTANSPTVNFTSDYDFHTSLAANITKTATNRCKDLDTVGYTLKESLKPFSPDPVNTRVTFKIPPDQPVIINAWAMISANANSRQVCGPIAARFTPRSGQIYNIHFTKEPSSCRMPITTADGESVDVIYLPKCR